MGFQPARFRVFKSDQTQGWITFSDGSKSEVVSSKDEAVALLEPAKAEGKLLESEALTVEQQIYASILPSTRTSIIVTTQ